MRFLFLNHNVVASGTYFRAFHFGRQLAARGHEVTLLTTSRDSRFRASTYERDGVEIVEAPDWMPGRARTGWDPYNTVVRSLLVRRRAFDVVHAFDSRPVVIHPALVAVTSSNALFVMDWADWWGRGGWMNERSGPIFRVTFGPIETWYEEAFRKRAHGMTVISRALGERTRQLGVAEERITRIPFGCARVEARRWTRSEAREHLGIAADARIVLHVGVLTAGDLGFLLEAFTQVKSEMPEAILAVAGRTGMRVLRRTGIHVTGPLSEEDMNAWLAAANVCVVPCRDTIGNRGRWPSKVNTYFSHQRAVVMPRVGDAAELIERAGAGVVTQPTPRSMAEGVMELLGDSEQADAFGEKGGQAAESELAWPHLTDRLVEFYDRVGALP